MAVPSLLHLLRIVPLATLLVLGLGSPGAAQAATRYVAPAGTGFACSSATPCSLSMALAYTASPGDEVVLGAGTYDVTSAVAVNGVWLHGAPGARPLIRNRSTSGTTAYVINDGKVSDIAAESPAPGTAAIAVAGGTVERILATGGSGTSTDKPGSGILVANSSGAGSVVRDSIARGGVGVYVNGTTSPVTVANVTALGDGYGLGVKGATGTVDVVNSILDGPIVDVAQDFTGMTSVSHSNFDSTYGTLGLTGNGSATPLLVDRAGGDLHQAPGSPTIDAGTTGQGVGSTDFDGNPRQLGTAPDVGAYEFVPPPPPSPPSPSPQDPPPVEVSPPSEPPVAPVPDATPAPPAAPAPEPTPTPEPSPVPSDDPAPPPSDPPAPETVAFLDVPSTIRMDARGRFPLTIGCPAASEGACSGRYTITVAVPSPVKPACAEAKGKRCTRRSRAGASSARKPKPKLLVVASGSFTVAAGKSKTVKVLARNGRIRAIRRQKGKCMAKVSTSSGGQTVTVDQPIKLVPAPGSRAR